MLLLIPAKIQKLNHITKHKIPNTDPLCTRMCYPEFVADFILCLFHKLSSREDHSLFICQFVLQEVDNYWLALCKSILCCTAIKFDFKEILNMKSAMCGSRKFLCPPQGLALEILRGMEVSKAKNSNECIKV